MASDQIESKARSTAAQLRDLILAGTARAGEPLGSEAALQREYGVSRATLRRALEFLEAEQLLEPREGPRGGFYVRTPSTSAVSHVASLYLRQLGTTEDELMVAYGAMVLEVVERAARHPSVVKRIALLDWVGEQQIRAENWDPPVFREYNNEFENRVSVLGGNRPLALFLTTLRDVMPYPTRLTHNEPVARALITAGREFHRLVAAAIANGDAAAAVNVARDYLVKSRELVKPEQAPEPGGQVRATIPSPDTNPAGMWPRSGRAAGGGAPR